MHRYFREWIRSSSNLEWMDGEKHRENEKKIEMKGTGWSLVKHLNTDKIPFPSYSKTKYTHTYIKLPKLIDYLRIIELILHRYFREWIRSSSNLEWMDGEKHRENEKRRERNERNGLVTRKIPRGS